MDSQKNVYFQFQFSIEPEEAAAGVTGAEISLIEISPLCETVLK